MPKGVPRFGQQTPASEVLGTIASDSPMLDTAPQGVETVWQSASGAVSFSEEPPPWELVGGDDTVSDANRYVDAPRDVTLRWINPRLLETDGWRDWRPVLASDKRFRVVVSTMISPDGNIRRGGAAGDILAYMPTHWVLSRRAILQKKTASQSQAAVDKQQALAEEFRRISPFLHMESAKHPTHTNADGRSMVDP